MCSLKHFKLILNNCKGKTTVQFIQCTREFMVFNATFKNIQVISWRSVLLVEDTGVPGENHRPGASH